MVDLTLISTRGVNRYKVAFLVNGEKLFVGNREKEYLMKVFNEDNVKVDTLAKKLAKKGLVKVEGEKVQLTDLGLKVLDFFFEESLIYL